MKAYPLVRIRWSNEHIMAALFLVLLLYMLPRWLADPAEILAFMPVLVLALVIDAAAGFIRYKRPVCSVSAAVTACILQVLTPGIPLWGRLAGIAAALLLGKHAWGGTGKNVINPALTGLLLLGMFFKFDTPFSEPALLYIPAMALSLPFLLFRPFAGAGLMAGLALSMLTGGGQQIWTVFISCVFYGCLVITDPVTVTHKPAEGVIGGFAAGYIPYALTGSIFYLPAGILIFNLLSYIIDLRVKSRKEYRYKNSLKLSKTVPQNGIYGEMLDLTGRREVEPGNIDLPEPGEIFRRMEKHDVYGMGGAAFSTSMKIKTLLESAAPEKYLVINAVECDPGLIHDKWLLKNRWDRIEKGIGAICSCIAFNKVFLAAKDISGIPQSDGLVLVKVPDAYPAGAEKILIKNVTGIKLPEEAIPAAEGILVLNVQTVLAIYDAVYKDMGADSRYITVSDLKNKKSRVVRVRLGDKIHDVLGKVYEGSNLAFAGGGVMQAHMAADEDVIDKSVNYIASANLPKYKESPQCSHCGLCRSECPAGLESGRITDLVDSGRVSETGRLNPVMCLGCGTCSYVCLAGRNLSARVREAKQYFRA